MTQFVAQLRRELWEHPVLYMAPVIIGGLVLMLVALMLLPGIGSDGGIRVMIDGLDMSDPRYAAAGVTAALLSFLPAFLLPLVVIVTFYLLDCLSAERRDRSILFFKSLPISDLTTVTSKIVTGLIVAPLLAIAALVVTQLGVLVLVSIAMAGVDGGLALLWSPSRVVSIWVLASYAALAFAVWYAPWFCFLALVSAWAKRATLVWASAPMLLVVVENALTGRSSLARLFAAHINGFWSSGFRHSFRVAIGAEEAPSMLENVDVDAMADVWSWMDPIGLVASPVLWAGLAVAASFTAAAVMIRRYRDDS